MTELIITEKPSAANKIATALADSRLKKESQSGVPYYTLTHKGKDIIVCCAVGHLYTIGEKEKTPWSKFPVYDVEWLATADIDKKADFSRKYLNTIKKIAKDADEFTVATDFDIEGEVIGLNIIRLACKRKDANRMKFSTLTKDELIYSYEHKSKTIDWGQANAGETRHILDFYYGINLTRALTEALNKSINGFKVLSSGRVQGPALKIIVDKEKEIQAFMPVPFWQIELDGLIKKSPIKAMHNEDKFWEKEKSDAVMKKVRSAKQGIISNAEKNQFNQNPPIPFNLTGLQVEAHRVFRFKPKHTLDIAQNLYTGGFISYPRTSSQKLPKQLGLKKIIEQLKQNNNYKELAEKILKTDLIPNEGKKTDDAHPSIFPTGTPPEGLDERDLKLYDLIVKRFLSVFAIPAIRETNILTIDVNKELFITKGTVTIKKGWHEFYYPYVKLDETELPDVKKNDIVDIKRISQLAKETKPPNRYTQSSIIQELEKKDLGTKATRASIIETLFQRGYVKGENNIEATVLGIKTSDTLTAHCPDIVNEELTRNFEIEMEKIRKNEISEEQVLEESKIVLNKIIERFKKEEKEIGQELADSNQEAIKIATTIGKCPNCKKGDLTLRRGKFGQFIGCNDYPDCKTIFNVPRGAVIKPTEKICEKCSLPIIIIRQPRKGPQEHCINIECETNKQEDQPDVAIHGKTYPEEGLQCPKCADGKMVLRKSFYGQFLGCDKYPKCKTMMKIVDGKVDTTPFSPKPKKKAKKAVKREVKKDVKKY
ncbi:MAG: DNA topoisomerase I [Candidatus Woesearchaeota archaeon]